MELCVFHAIEGIFGMDAHTRQPQSIHSICTVSLTWFLDFADAELSDAVQLLPQLLSHFSQFLGDADTAFEGSWVDDLLEELWMALQCDLYSF